MSKQKESKQVRMDSWLFKLLSRDMKKNKKNNNNNNNNNEKRQTNINQQAIL